MSKKTDGKPAAPKVTRPSAPESRPQPEVGTPPDLFTGGRVVPKPPPPASPQPGPGPVLDSRERGRTVPKPPPVKPPGKKG